MRGRKTGRQAAARARPFSFMHWTMEPCARALLPKGIVIVFYMGERSH